MSKWVYEPFVEAVTEALDNLQQGGTKPATSRQIKEWIRANKPGAIAALEPSWGVSLFHAKNDPMTRIKNASGSLNKYILSPPTVTATSTAATPAEESASTEPKAVADPGPAGDVAPEPGGEEGAGVDVIPSAKKMNVQRESALYPVLRDWLNAKGYWARITATAKSGGTWGNPDVCGIHISEGFLGQREIEVATVEAKVSQDGWRLQFFEAVSHRRFAHRVYFAFAVESAADEVGVESVPDAQELRKYAEEFGIGVLAVFVTSDAMVKLRTGDRAALDALKLDLEEVGVVEVWPAIRRPVQLGATTEFLFRTLKIEDDAALYKFGDDDTSG
jgi:hypothetical protein